MFFNVVEKLRRIKMRGGREGFGFVNVIVIVFLEGAFSRVKSLEVIFRE